MSDSSTASPAITTSRSSPNTTSSGSGQRRSKTSSSNSNSTAQSLPPNADAQYAAASAAAARATAQTRAAPSLPAKREKFADLKWMWSRQLTRPNDLRTKEQWEQMVLGSQRVQAAIERGTSESSSSGASTTREEATKQAQAMFESMYADINDTNVRMSMYVMRKVWRTMYEGIRVNEEGIQMLHELKSQKVPVVLLPMHKSHVDYLLLSYVCAAYNLYPPHIIAGDNLNMAIVGHLLKHGGGLFIRRVFGNDELYKSVFYEYIAALMQNGHTLECFIEGTRSRMGKLRTPKIGFLSVLVDLLVTGRLGANDIMLVPIAISYDKVIEGSTYVNEMLGAKKQKESFTQTINSVNHVIRLNFGSIDVSICQAISMRETLGMNSSRLSPSSFLSFSHHEQKRIITSLAHKICYEMNLKLVISATSIIATVLLTNLNRGIARKDIITKAETIKHMIIDRGGSVAHIFAVEPMSAIVDRALKVLNKLLQEQHNIVFGFRNITSLELSFYRNQLLHFFVSESLVCIAMAAEYKDVKQIKSSSPTTSLMVEKTKLIESVRFISQLLKFEYIYKPAPDLEDNVEATIHALITRGVLRPCMHAATDEQTVADGGHGNILTLRGVELNPSGVDTFLFLSMLSWPFLETYWVALASLFVLLPDVIMEAKKLSEVASRRAEALFYSGHIEFYECLNTESIMNAYEWCISQNILRVHNVGNTRMMQLTPEYQHAPEEPTGATIPVPQYSPTFTSHSSTTSSSTPSSSSSPSQLSGHPVDGSISSAVPFPSPSLTKRHTSLERTMKSTAPTEIHRKSLRELVLRVGRFRKIRLVASDSSKSLLESFVDELCHTADQPPQPQTAAATAATAATNAAAAAQKLLKARM